MGVNKKFTILHQHQVFETCLLDFHIDIHGKNEADKAAQSAPNGFELRIGHSKLTVSNSPSAYFVNVL